MSFWDNPPEFDDLGPSRKPMNDNDLLTEMMRSGKTRDEIRAAIRQGVDAGRLAGPHVGEAADARQQRMWDYYDYLQQTASTGYQQYREKVQGWNAQGIDEQPMAEWQWNQLPGHARQRWLSGEHVKNLGRDEYNRLDYGDNWVHRKGQEHVFDVGAITRASFLGREGNQIISTWEPSKVMKRIQMLGAHEQVGFSDVPTVRGPVRAGPGSPITDNFSVMRSAFILGGEPGSPGMGYIDPSVGNVTSRRVKDVYARAGEQLTGMPEIGRQWMPGEDIKLADQLNPFSDRSWGTEVLDYAPISRQTKFGEEQGYRYVLGRSADLSTARVRMKAYAGKLEAVRSDLSGITDPQGRSLGIQFAGAMKDVQGTVYSHFMARDPHYLAEKVGMDVANLPSSYSELGAKPMSAFADLMESDAFKNRYIKTINWATTVHESQLEQFRPVMTGEPEALGNGRYRINRQYQAFVDDMALGFSRDYDVKQPFLGHEELQNLRRANPDAYQQVMQESRGGREAYRRLVGSALQSTGEYELPTYATSLTKEAMQGYHSQAVQQTRERLGVEDLSLVNRFAVNKELLGVLSQGEMGNKPMVFGDQENFVVTPSAKTLSRFGAMGPFVGEEVSPMMSALTDVFASSGTGEYGGAVKTLREEMFKLAGSKESVRRMTGAMLGNDRMRGDVVRGSEALAPWEAYVPGFEENALVNMVRFPTQGQSSWSPETRGVNISSERASQLGLDPDAMYASNAMVQAAAGDMDGDLMYALTSGKAQQRVDSVGNAIGLFDDEGRRVDVADPFDEAAERTRNAGAQNLAEEYVGMAPGKPAPTLEQARTQFAETLRNPQRFSEGQLQESIQQGMGLYGDIGKYYQPFRYGMAMTPEHDEGARAALQEAWNRSHTLAQQPKALTPGMQRFQDLMTYNPATGGLYQRGSKSPGKAMAGGASGLMADAALALSMDDISPETFAGLMGPEHTRKDLAASWERFSSGTGSRGQRLFGLTQEMSGILGGAEGWMNTSTFGNLLGGQAVSRGQKEGLTLGQTAQQLGISESAASMLNRQWDRGQKYAEMVRHSEKRYSSGDQGVNVDPLAQTVENMRDLGMGGLPQRKQSPTEMADDILAASLQADRNIQGARSSLDAAVVRPTAGGVTPPPPSNPPVTIAAPEPEGPRGVTPDQQRAAIEEGLRVAYARAGIDRDVPFSSSDLTPAERRVAEQQSVRIEGGGAVAPDMGGMMPQMMGGGGNFVEQTIQQGGLRDPNKPTQKWFTTATGGSYVTREVNSQGSMMKTLDKLDAIDAGMRRAMSGQQVDDAGMMEWYSKSGVTATEVGRMRSIQEASISGQPTSKSLNALTSMSLEYDKLSAQAGKESATAEHLAPYDLGTRLSEDVGRWSQELNPRSPVNQERGMGDIGQRFGKLADNLERLNKAVPEFEKAIAGAEKAVKGTYDRPEQGSDAVRKARRLLGTRESIHSEAFGTLAGQVEAIETHGLEDQFPEYRQAKERLGQVQSKTVEDRRRVLDMSQREAEFASETERRQQSGFRQIGRLFGLSMAPWQLQFARMWGTDQGEQAFQYASGVDAQMRQAMFSAGVAGDGMSQGQQRMASQEWGQYYVGQGASGAVGNNRFMAENPELARGVGAASQYGQYIGYGLAAEMVATQTFQRGLFTGDNALFRGDRAPLWGQAAGLGVVAGMGVLGAGAVVDVANATQDRTRTTWEGVTEAGRNLGRVGGIISGGIGLGSKWVGEQIGGDNFFTRFSENLGERLRGDEWISEPTESEERDAARKKSPAYKRQQAILDAMKGEGLSPEQAAQYSTIYSQMGILDPQKQAQMAGQAFGLEQMAGLGAGQLGASTMGIVQKLGFMPGSQQGLQQQLYSTLQGYAQNQPDRFQALSAGLDTAAGMVGEWPARLGMNQDWTARFTEHTGKMLASGSSQWEVNKYIQGQTGSTPRAWSRKMRDMGFDDLALQDEMGRPVTFGLEREVRDTGRALDIERTQLGFGIEAEQIGMQKQWMQKSWGIEDMMTGLRNRYRVEDADMGLRSMALRLEQAQQGQKQQQTQNQWSETQMNWRESDIDTSSARAAIQYGWQQADFNTNRQQMTQQYGWQMEDFDRAIRHASGRQRIQLKEQRERATVQQNWRTEELNTSEQRAGVQYGWGQEDREKSLDRLREEADMRREMQSQEAEMSRKNLDLLKEQYDQEVQRRKELVEMILPAEKEQEKIQREQATKGLEWREKRHEMDVKYFEIMQPLQDKLTQASDKMSEAWTLWQTTMEEGIPNASAIFLKNFGEDSSAYRALQKWQDLLTSFDRLGGGSSGSGTIANAADTQIRRWMDRQFPAYSLR
jgi:hypothetical protein